MKQRRVRTVPAPVFQRQVVFWTGVVVLLGVLLWLLSEILLPFVAGMAIAYLLTPFVDRIE
ncbi:MAG: AI-2E family transporter, partial [Pseudolabrys sp.]|nr:AI-2E family transporter [Pseudolabrys sp.]